MKNGSMFFNLKIIYDANENWRVEIILAKPVGLELAEMMERTIFAIIFLF